MNPNQNLQIPLFHTTYQYHWVLIRKRGPYWYDTGKSYALRCQRCAGCRAGGAAHTSAAPLGELIAQQSPLLLGLFFLDGRSGSRSLAQDRALLALLALHAVGDAHRVHLRLRPALLATRKILVAAAAHAAHKEHHKKEAAAAAPAPAASSRPIAAPRGIFSKVRHS